MPKTVLLVDDEASYREMVRPFFGEQGIIVKEAMDGDEAIQWLIREIPDLIVLDILMPKRDGYAVLSYMKVKGMSVPTVIFSSFSDALTRETCLKFGAKDYIVKGEMDDEELRERMQKYL